MKKICLFVNLLLMIAILSHAQLSKWVIPAFTGNDSIHAKIISQESVHPYFSLRLIPSNYYSTHLGFFCRQEIKMQHATKLPFVFRLGSPDYNNYLEQKPNAVKP